MNASDTAEWEDAFPDPTERATWQTHFPEWAPNAARNYRRHFADPAAAAAWWDAAHFPSDICAYAHSHGIDPDDDQCTHAVAAGDTEAGGDVTREGSLRGALMLAHPNLTQQDRDAIVASGITLTELDRLIAIGAYNRSTLTLMAGLT